MALSTCVKCGNHNFELRQAEPIGSNYKMYFVQCATCGGVVGVQDFYNTNALVQKQAEQLQNLVTNTQTYLASIADGINRLLRK